MIIQNECLEMVKGSRDTDELIVLNHLRNPPPTNLNLRAYQSLHIN